jgi:tetratricopeptide (TPR) repeat protein
VYPLSRHARRVVVATLLCALAPAATSPASADPPRVLGLAELDRAVMASPADVEQRLQRAEALRRSTRLNEAGDDLRIAEALRPGDARITLIRARIAVDAERWLAARALLDAFLAQRGPHAEALRLRARVLQQAGDTDGALRDLAAVVALGGDLDAHLERASLLERSGRLADAHDALAEGAFATGSAVLYERLAGVSLALGRFDDALAHLDSARAEEPPDARHLLARARILDTAGRHVDARAARLAARADAEARLARRTTAFALAERGEALLGLGEHARGIADLQAALALVPRLPDARRLLDAATRASHSAGGAQ